MSSINFSLTDETVRLSNGLIAVEAHLDQGTFDLTEEASGRCFIASAAASILLTDGTRIITRGRRWARPRTVDVHDAHGHGLALELRREGGIALVAVVYEHQPFVILSLHFTNESSSAAKIQALHPLEGAVLDLGGPAMAWKIYKEGWQNWTPALVLPCDGEDLYWSPPVIGPTTQPPAAQGRFLGEMMATIKDTITGHGLVVGFITTARQFSQVWLDRDGPALTTASWADGLELSPGQTIASEKLLIEPSAHPLAAMQSYGDVLAREMNATPWPHPVTGWCSWYYYWQGVSEEAVLANLEFLRWRRDELPVQYVQIDDGYQSGIGDWLVPNHKFPRGMKWLADQIHDRGFKAGLWLAPFMIGAHSQLWKDHPDWAVQHSSRRPYVAMVNWAQECYAMDLTRPDVLEWLEHVFRTVFHEWGYDYVKIDFLYAGAVDGLRYDPNVTRAQAYRRAIEIIRRQAGDRFILGCGNPVAPSIGIMNGMRIGPDVAPFWYPAEPPREKGRNELSLVSTINGIRNVMSRFWMHNRLWLNDPDCMLARDSETALTLDEVRSLASVIALSGGMVFDSDNLMRLSDQRRALLARLLPPCGRSAVPLDLFESSPPSLFALDCGAHQVLGTFNWADSPAEIQAPLPQTPTHVFDVWQETHLGCHSGSLSFLLPAHGCKLLGLRRALERPQLIGSSFHLLQGALEIESEDWDGQTLTIRLRPVATRMGTLFFHLPEGYSQPTVGGVNGQLEARQETELLLHLRLERPCELRLRFPQH